MSDSKKYYWLKLKEDFFSDKVVKYLRKLPDGNALVIVYLKMQLKCLKTEGFIKYDGILPTIEEELALILDEEPNLVRLAVNALIQARVVERWDEETLYISALQPLIGSETAVAERVRRHRDKKKALEQGKNNAMLPEPLQCNAIETTCNTEIEKEIDIELEKEKEIERIDYQKVVNMYNETCVSFPRIRTLSENRKKTIRARIHQGYTYDELQEAFTLAEQSSFLKGGNDRNWSATFDWIMKDANLTKILEGNYNDRVITRKPAQPSGNPFLDKLREAGEI